MTMEVEQKKSLPLIFVLPAATALLYLYSYVFEAGYAFRFGYPSGFTVVSLGIILNFGTALFFYAVFFVTFMQLHLQAWPHTKKHIFQLTTVFVLFFAFLIVLKLVLRDSSPVMLAGISSVIGSLSAYIGIFATRKYYEENQNSDAGAVPMIYDSGSEIPEGSIAHRMIDKLGYDPALFIVLLLIIMPVLFYGAGFAEARSTTVFYVFEESGSKYISLRISGSRVVAAKLDSSETKYHPDYIARPLQEIGSMQRVDIPDIARATQPQ